MQFLDGSHGCSEARERTSDRPSLWASGQRADKAFRRNASEKDKVRARKASARVERVISHAPSQAAELQRRWRISTLLDHHDEDDDDLISSTRTVALRRAGLPNLGNTCFINAARYNFWRARCFLHASTWKQARLLRRLPKPRFTPCFSCSATRRCWKTGSAAPHVAFWFRVARCGLQSVWL